ncbi:CPBP family intramembrane glutamic endopeptidase [Phytohabitans sp. ZYX-F-186]|uniref:CPBP family intramembrane glutamic endopeptidase n=1 Tax=Phytohabitans maris TaxID=3071409 RepID=A0ABU0ZSF9_9ACTN|nr:CPBP family intramembrane glutamic endopeptidase [Phytohabitans sp. ZYX-F-186]MDQ7909422.1 CPBP family intramembrane glutamic endopeptidase [Phytohabitans sp. ZYX-F-186]
MRLLKQLGAVAVVAFAGQLGVALVEGNAVLTLLLGIATAVLALFAYRWVVRRTERRAPVEAEWGGAAGGVSRGVLIGAGLFAAVIVNIAFLGGYRVEGWGSVSGAVGLFGFMAAAAVTEEVIFRGVLFRIVEGWIGTWAALSLTALVFGLSHLFNENASLWGAIAVAVAGGGMLVSAYAATRTLWVPIGLHFGWNFAQAGVFGTQVSGNGESEGLLEGVTSGSTLLSGGAFGPEASLYTVVAGVLVTTVFMVLARRRGHVVSRRRRPTPAVAAR